MANTIKRNIVLRDMEIREDDKGNARTFSIKYIKKNGELVYYPRAVASGLKVNMTKNRVRGVIPVDEQGDSIDDPKMIGIDRIIEYNNLTVLV